MTNRTTILALACLVTACSHLGRSTKSAAQSEGAVIVRLVGRDTTLTARASDHGPVYSLHRNDGQEIVVSKTLGELHAEDPDLARRVKMLHATPWAGID